MHFWQRFSAMAAREADRISKALPAAPHERFVLFVEVTRAVDYWHVSRTLGLDPDGPNKQHTDLVQWGWNAAVASLFNPLDIPGSFLLQESSQGSQQFAVSLLYQLGRSVLLRRAAEMLRVGLLEAQEIGERVEINHSGGMAGLQAADLFEAARFERFNREHLSKEPLFPERRLPSQALEARMSRLAFPWDSGRGVMTGYDAEPEVDDHFFVAAMDSVLLWRDEAGIHPETRFGRVSGADVVAVAASIIALHWKHIYFVLAATRRFPEISIVQSLTIWRERDVLIRGLKDYMHADERMLRDAVDLLALKVSDLPMLRDRTSPFRPLLIDLGNGMDLCPVSGAGQNPFHSIRQLQEWRDPSNRHHIASPREEWMRNDLYHLFLGTRYRCIQGNIKVRAGGKVVTDLDAVIFDVVSGDVAVFQIKWQDFFTNDVKALRSKAKNLSDEMRAWSQAVEAHVLGRSPNELQQLLRLRLPASSTIGKVHLFGLSRTTGRVGGYGYQVENERLAIANWPQFARIRFEVGPTEDVFGEIHRRIRKESQEALAAVAMPMSIVVEGREIIFNDFWNGFEDQASDAALPDWMRTSEDSP